jgi:hypothetical protein
MDPINATREHPVKDIHLPPMHQVGDFYAPTAPKDVAGARVDEGVLSDLVAKLSFTVARFTTDWVAKQLHLSMPLASQLLEQLALDGLIESMLGSRYTITDRGREQALRLLEVCGYIGPAPVRLESYAAMLRWQFAHTPPITPEEVEASLSNLVVTPEAAKLGGLAISSGRSLFVYGPPGNGKSSIGRALHNALVGEWWIPHAISVGSSVIRVYDDQNHQKVDISSSKAGTIDQRWVRIKRPFVIVGGELTLEMLDLIFSPTLRYYEAAPHLKANGGVFMVDDFGRERVSPDQLLNRFITPMEHQVDYFSLNTGQKIEIPLRHTLIIATNLNPELVTDPAFLRRIGYRLYLGPPTPDEYAQIFRAYAKRNGVEAPPELINRILKRYQEQNRELRACEPRDLIDRARDICTYESRPMELNNETIDLAWTGYFGNEQKA